MGTGESWDWQPKMNSNKNKEIAILMIGIPLRVFDEDFLKRWVFSPKICYVEGVFH
jgi:hypothetical protein